MTETKKPALLPAQAPEAEATPKPVPSPASETSTSEIPAREIGGRKGPEPTRYGDWEKNGIISDF